MLSYLGKWPACRNPVDFSCFIPKKININTVIDVFGIQLVSTVISPTRFEGQTTLWIEMYTRQCHSSTRIQHCFWFNMGSSRSPVVFSTVA